MNLNVPLNYIALLGNSEDVVDTEDKPEEGDEDATKPDEAEEETTAEQQPETIAEQSAEETEVTDQADDQ